MPPAITLPIQPAIPLHIQPATASIRPHPKSSYSLYTAIYSSHTASYSHPHAASATTAASGSHTHQVILQPDLHHHATLHHPSLTVCWTSSPQPLGPGPARHCPGPCPTEYSENHGGAPPAVFPEEPVLILCFLSSQSLKYINGQPLHENKCPSWLIFH